MQFTHSISTGYVSLKFGGKPSATVRSIMKAARFRWSPGSAEWWSRKVTGAADIIEAIQKQLDKESGIRRPDGPCHKCQAPDGFLRLHGAASTVLCDACEQLDRDEYNRKYHSDPVDMAYEDDCARQCGLI